MNSLNLIPLDKSWVIRCICLDIIHENSCYKTVLENYRLSDDIFRAKFAAENWKTSRHLSVGESATLLRFLRYISWKQQFPKTFHMRGTLKNRNVSFDKNILNMSFEELLKLDGGTSQWASIAYLCGKREGLPKEVPFKLQTTIDVVNHYKQKRKGRTWSVELDNTIRHQIQHFYDIVYNRTSYWIPKQAEDYCFARAFELITAEEGLNRWPSLLNHESNRIVEMEKEIKNLKSSNVISSSDHRVVQALVLKRITEGGTFSCMNPQCVSKSWPEFWDFVNNLKSEL